jgi:nucleoside 2-deoxyribosyltransferase
MHRLYLAGPDVFAPSALEIGRAKQRICAALGAHGIYPSDLVALPLPADRRAAGLHVYDALERGMRDCDAIVADLTPFHGPSMDVGTAFEVGFMRALARPVFAYSAATEDFATRMHAYWRGDVARRHDDSWQGADGSAIEDFDMAENLMLHGCVLRSTSVLTTATTDPSAPYANFEACVRAAVAFLTRAT